MRFLHACASDRKRLFFEPVYSLKLGELSGRLNGFVTSERKLCFEKLKKRTKLSNGRVTKSLNFLRYLKFSIVTDGNVVQVLHTALNSDGFAHLNHSCALFGFQKFNSSYIACKDKENLHYRHPTLLYRHSPYKQTRLKSLSVLEVIPSSP